MPLTQKHIIGLSGGLNNGLHALGYNSAESEPIWMKSGTVCAKVLGALADFGPDPCSSEFERHPIFWVTRITHDFTDFPSDKFYDIC